ncbi:uncharacterized protein LOC108737799 [Agrilus planipennis]|uniref:Uncharacterized protein LOC108737799 n=1 Tax=Agrilus planipennis TaxID=224129 RepID=A0A1W4WR70_AGRPL|nr:uncharacterized protein LOC108737799 [Agrilus planipennis]
MEDGTPSNQVEMSQVTGYYLRSKRRRLNNDGEEISPYSQKRRYVKRKSPILTMPTEILQKIFRKMTCEELSVSVRLVNRRFKILAEDLLNSEFLLLYNRLQSSKDLVAFSLQSSSHDSDINCYSKFLSAIDILIFHYTLVRATIWRYIYYDMRKSILCMYGGKIVDDMHSVLNKLLTIKDTSGTYHVLQVLPAMVQQLCVLCKQFNISFEKGSEMPINKSPLISGAKILDILNCATNCVKTVGYERLRKNMYVTSVQYYFTNSWFVSFNIPSKKSRNMAEKMRLMFMRVRRIVNAHSEMSLENDSYERELSLQPDSSLRVKKPPNAIYTGYGEVGRSFFFYGVMNEGAYFQKFVRDYLEEDEDDDADAQATSPNLGIRFKIELTCSIELAPYDFVKKISEDITIIRELNRNAAKDEKRIFEMNMQIDCPGAANARLPSVYNMRLHHMAVS